MNPPRKDAFDWEHMGAVSALSRPSLGNSTTVEVYRLMQFTLRDVLEQRYGTEMTDTLFREAGVLAGKAFFEHYCSEAADLPALAKTIQEHFRTLGVGIVRFEVTDAPDGAIQLTVDEDLDCSGLPDTAEHVCVYDEGFIKGILDSFSHKTYSVKEIDCWCSGARTCRFRATPES